MGLNLGQAGQNRDQSWVFFIFSSLVHWFSFIIALQYLITSRVKTCKKKFGGPDLDQMGQNQAQHQFFLPFSKV